mmetsp:Transcript_6237/g.18095  ORF Transcript_6237/g.18095 Transcript_6237/m.18095 type:complete len:227 (-) Transcript_6237:247-927(-)
MPPLCPQPVARREVLPHVLDDPLPHLLLLDVAARRRRRHPQRPVVAVDAGRVKLDGARRGLPLDRRRDQHRRRHRHDVLVGRPPDAREHAAGGPVWVEEEGKRGKVGDVVHLLVDDLIHLAAISLDLADGERLLLPRDIGREDSGPPHLLDERERERCRHELREVYLVRVRPVLGLGDGHRAGDGGARRVHQRPHVDPVHQRLPRGGVLHLVLRKGVVCHIRLGLP